MHYAVFTRRSIWQNLHFVDNILPATGHKGSQPSTSFHPEQIFNDSVDRCKATMPTSHTNLYPRLTAQLITGMYVLIVL